MVPFALVALVSLLDAPGSPQPILPSKPVTRSVKAGEIHAYSLKLEAGAFLRLRVQQKGIDLVLTAFAPGGAKVAEVDGPTGAYGPEILSLQATAAGTYTFQVQSLEPEVAPGRYEMKVEALVAPEIARKYAKKEVPPAALQALLGTYEMAPGHRVTLNPVSGLGAEVGLLFTDLKTRETRILHPRSATSFFGGDSVQGDYPVSLEVERVPEGLRIAWKGQSPEVARWLPCRTEEVSFRNGEVELKGTLVLPEGKGPFPAVVYAHGSGPLRRESLYGATFYPRGVAYLSFDKRGTGASTGDWRRASLKDLAEDVVAGIRALKSRPDIQGDRIGVIGISQGGWVGALAATSPEVKFLVVHSGSGVAVAENIVHEQRSQMVAAGFTPAQLRAGEDFLRRTGRMATEGRPWSEIHAEYERAKAEPHGAFAFPASLPPESPWWEWFKKNGDVDTAEILKGVKCPVLWYLADLDTQVPTARSAPRLREALKQAGHRESKVKVMRRASHMLLETRPDLHGADLGRFVPGFWEEMSAWVERQAFKSPEAAR